MFLHSLNASTIPKNNPGNKIVIFEISLFSSWIRDFGSALRLRVWSQMKATARAPHTLPKQFEANRLVGRFCFGWNLVMQPLVSPRCNVGSMRKRRFALYSQIFSNLTSLNSWTVQYMSKAQEPNRGRPINMMEEVSTFFYNSLELGVSSGWKSNFKPLQTFWRRAIPSKMPWKNGAWLGFCFNLSFGADVENVRSCIILDLKIEIIEISKIVFSLPVLCFAVVDGFGRC